MQSYCMGIKADKLSNSCGIQLADLVAYPLARHLLRPTQESRAYSVIEKKLYRYANGLIDDWNLTSTAFKIEEAQEHLIV